MSYKIIWYDEAVNELDEIYSFYFKKNPKAAIKIYNLILAETRYLKENPNIAAIEPLLKDKSEVVFRSLVTKDGLFKIIYFCDDDSIIISRIWCCRSDPKKLSL